MEALVVSFPSSNVLYPQFTIGTKSIRTAGWKQVWNCTAIFVLISPSRDMSHRRNLLIILTIRPQAVESTILLSISLQHCNDTWSWHASLQWRQCCLYIPRFFLSSGKGVLSYCLFIYDLQAFQVGIGLGERMLKGQHLFCGYHSDIFLI